LLIFSAGFTIDGDHERLVAEREDVAFEVFGDEGRHLSYPIISFQKGAQADGSV
jgi:hypothetical protein